MSHCFVKTSVARQINYQSVSCAVNMFVKTSETGCSLVALFFFDFPSLRTDSFLDNIAPWHISVLKSLFLKAAVVSPVVCFTLATIIGAMDVLLSAG